MKSYYDLELKEQVEWLDKARDMFMFQPGLYKGGMKEIEELAVLLYKKSKWTK